MWDSDEFVAKARMYFDNADAIPTSADDPVDYSEALWLLLGLEFLLRAPLARVHPTLLASTEGVSILHAAGYGQPEAKPRSIPTKTVIDRFSYIEPDFNEDRKKKALFLADLRNGELHTSAAVLEDLKPEAWLPQLLDVVGSIANHLHVYVDDLLPASVVERASAASAKLDRRLSAEVGKKISAAKEFFIKLTADEVAARLAARPPRTAGQVAKDIDCPACANKSAIVKCGPSRASNGSYDEELGTISYRITYVAESAECRVCNLNLENTAELVAAGVPRLFVDQYEEDRYEGWQNVLDASEMIEHLGIGEPDYDYGND